MNTIASRPYNNPTRAVAWRIAGLSLALGLVLWGWFALTLSPLQRHYFAAYVASSLHRTGSSEQDLVVWVLKTEPPHQLAIAEPEDLVPVTHGPVGFALSRSAQAQGWADTDLSVPASYPAGSQRLLLRQEFFDDRSLSALFLPLLQLLALPLIVWLAFVYWRWERNRARGPAWVWVHGETSLPEDVWQFSRDMTEASKFVVVSLWRWAQKQGRAVKERRARGRVLPSGVHPEAQAAQAPAPQPIEVESVPMPRLSRAETLPFRKRQAAESSAAGRGDAR